MQEVHCGVTCTIGVITALALSGLAGLHRHTPNESTRLLMSGFGATQNSYDVRVLVAVQCKADMLRMDSPFTKCGIHLISG